MTPAPKSDAVLRLEAERDLYRDMVVLGEHDDIGSFLEHALALVVVASGARRGYIELLHGDGPPSAMWFADSQRDAPRFSRGVIDHTLATGETVTTVAAADDPRFRERESVKSRRLQAVLCVPVGRFGVVYVQDRVQPGPFSPADTGLVETFARQVAPFAERLLLREHGRSRTDVTRDARERLAAGSVVGRSRALAACLKQVALIAASDLGVLIEGPTGAGKTQLARVVHDSGPRAKAPFVELSCATLPEQLVESELFGALAGAHSTATASRAGKVEAAEGGTLFLDEVSELTLAAQSKLLQLLQSGEYTPLGSTTPRRANVRVLAATNVDLREAVTARRFREDLFYRLHVIPIRVPSLAERPEDIALLIEHFLERIAGRTQSAQLSISPKALQAAEVDEWPGNVRQLAHAVEAAVIRAQGEGVTEIQTRHLFPDHPPSSGAARRQTYQQAMTDAKRQVVREALAETKGNVTDAAHLLDVSRSYLNKLIGALGLSGLR